MVIWKPVIGYEGLYEVNNIGQVKSLNYNHTGKAKTLALKKWKTGYCGYTLSKSGITKNKFAHVLVATAFIENENNLPSVNHIDGNKLNNCVENLEWVSKSDNTRHAIKNGLRKDSYMRGVTGAENKNSKMVKQIKGGIVVKTWGSISDAARSLGCKPCTIVNCSKGRIKSCKGYQWEII